MEGIGLKISAFPPLCEHKLESRGRNSRQCLQSTSYSFPDIKRLIIHHRPQFGLHPKSSELCDDLDWLTCMGATIVITSVGEIDYDPYGARPDFRLCMALNNPQCQQDGANKPRREEA